MNEFFEFYGKKFSRKAAKLAKPIGKFNLASLREFYSVPVHPELDTSLNQPEPNRINLLRPCSLSYRCDTVNSLLLHRFSKLKRFASPLKS